MPSTFPSLPAARCGHVTNPGECIVPPCRKEGRERKTDFFFFLWSASLGLRQMPMVIFKCDAIVLPLSFHLSLPSYLSLFPLLSLTLSHLFSPFSPEAEFGILRIRL